MDTVKKIWNNDFIFNIVSKVLLVLVGLVASSFLTRYLSIELRGEYSYVCEVALIASLIICFGIEQSYSYFYKKNEGNIFKRFVNIYSLQFLILIVIAIPLLFLFEIESSIFLICLLVPFDVLNKQLAGCMSVENIRLKIIVEFIGSVAKAVLFVVLFLFRTTIGTYVFFIVLSLISIYFFQFLVYLIYCRTMPNPFNIDFCLLKEILKFSWIPMLSGLMLLLNYSLDIVFLKHICPSEELSYYSVAVGIINYVWLIPDAIKEVLISRVARENNSARIIKALKYSLIITVAIIILFIFLGKLAIIIMYGEEFLPAYLVTIVLSIGALSMVLFKVLNVSFLAEGKRIFYFIILSISVVMNIVLNLITIPVYGMYGAAVSSIVSYSICGVTFLIKFIRDKQISFKDFLGIKSKGE